MANKSLAYHKIINFTTNGNLGISTNVINEIVKQAVNDCDGASIAEPHSYFKRASVNSTFTKKGELVLDVCIRVDVGLNAIEVSGKVQEKIEHDLMYMTEIRPYKIHIRIADMSKK